MDDLQLNLKNSNEKDLSNATQKRCLLEIRIFLKWHTEKKEAN